MLSEKMTEEVMKDPYENLIHLLLLNGLSWFLKERDTYPLHISSILTTIINRD